MEKCSFGFTLASSNLDENSFRGMASVFHHIIDAWIPTRILPGAFTKTLRENRKRVKVLYQHNESWPIGLPTRLEENSSGLLVEAKISPTTMGKDVLQLMRDKVLTELSIGFDPIKDTMVEEDVNGVKVKVRHLLEVRLWEVSPVTFGANSKATISAVNSSTRMRSIDAALAELGDADSWTRSIDAKLAELDRLQSAAQLDHLDTLLRTKLR